jgi:hypothetical protein
MRASRPVLAAVVCCASASALVPGALAADATPDPQRLLADAGANLAKVRSLHLDLKATDADGTTTVRADLTAKGDGDILLRQGGEGTARIRQVSSRTWLRADAAFWRSAGGKEGGAAAKALAGRWVALGSADSTGLGPILAELAPKRLARCLTAEGSTGTLSLGTPTTYRGQRVDVLRDAGDRPGTAPGTLYVTAGSRPLPVRMLQTGKTSPGGTGGVCGTGEDEEDTTTSAELRFSKYDRVPAIRAPKHAVTIPSAGTEA